MITLILVILTISYYMFSHGQAPLNDMPYGIAYAVTCYAKGRVVWYIISHCVVIVLCCIIAL